MEEITLSSLKYKLDAVAGTQQAMACALNLLLASYKGNQQAIAALENGFERSRSSLLASSASDYSLQAFDEISEALVLALKGHP